MRVGVYIPAYPPEAGGGYTFERDVLEALLRHSGECGHKFTIFSPDSPPDLIQALAGSDQVRFCNIGSELSLVQKLFRRATKLINYQGRYLSHLNSALEKWEMECLWFLTPVYQPVNIPYITIVWDLQHRLQPWFPEVGTHREWQERERIYSDLIRRASYVITGTKVGQEETSLFYQIPRQRIRILPLPTPAFINSAGRDHIQPVLEKYQLSPGFIFYPAQFWPHKNHVNLLLAVRTLQQQYKTDIDVVLVGSEKGNIEYIRRIAYELDIEKQVHILGFVTQAELIALYQSALALVFVSYFGPDNLPPMEAFGVGCPVIASAVSGAEEQLGEAALLVDPSSPADIAEAVKTLMENPDRRKRLIELGFEKAASWTADDFVRGVFAILDEFEPIRRSWK